MNTLVKLSTNIPANWAWRTRFGEYIQPVDMETRHLFCTLRMIWHNRMPRDAWIMTNPRLYNFGSMYSDEYMKFGILAMAIELAKRKDLTQEWTNQLDQMIRYVATNKYIFPSMLSQTKE